VALARSLVREARGGAADGLAVLRDAWRVHRQRANGAALAQLGPDLVRLALADGERTLAEEVATVLDDAAAGGAVAGVVVAAWWCRGLVDADADRVVRAADALAAGPRRFRHAEACEAAAGELARGGRVAEAKPRFDAAIDAFEAIGAQRAAARALASARQLGVGRMRRGARKRPTYGWAALTPAEREVASLVAEGLTNPEVGQRLFISRRTVQTHLSNAFRKLEIASRVELAALVARQERA
jgi:DNA-binding CsgD family transcriptional regulator